jgi:NADPH-dependent 7-cyano-7-deazaguanine reductase QueF
VSARTSGPIRHLCPYVDEIDEGVVTIGWRTDYVETFELHSLRAYLDTFADVQISHEALVNQIKDDLEARIGRGVTVSGKFTTAGLDCEVTAR